MYICPTLEIILKSYLGKNLDTEKRVLWSEDSPQYLHDVQLRIKDSVKGLSSSRTHQILNQ